LAETGHSIQPPFLATVLTNANRERIVLTADEAGEGGEAEKISEDAT